MKNNLILFLFVVIGASAITTSNNTINLSYGQTTEQSQQSPIVELTGQQFFPNGTGMAYFSDNSSRPFTHVMTPDKGYFYDNSTNYTIGTVPGVSEFRNATMENTPLTGRVINITIPSGAELLPPDLKFQPNVVRVKLGDTIQFVNQDYTVHRVVSPPFIFGNSGVPMGTTIDTGIIPAGSVSNNFTALVPGGYFFNDWFTENATGTIIIEEANNTTTNATESANASLSSPNTMTTTENASQTTAVQREGQQSNNSNDNSSEIATTEESSTIPTPNKSGQQNTGTTSTPTPPGGIELTGQQYYENGTGKAYFSDGSTRPFKHSITPQNGFYYDNSTTFLSGEIPGYEMPENWGAANLTGQTINITIPSGAGMLPDNQKFQPNIIRAQVGDTINFKNNDSQVHQVVSPPNMLIKGDTDNQVSSGQTFDSSTMFPGGTYAFTLSRAGGYHFNDYFNEDATGVILVEEK